MTSLGAVRRIVTGHDDKALGNIQSDSHLRFEDIPGMPGAKAAAIWVTADGVPTNDNNRSEDGAERIVQGGLVQHNGTNVRCTDLAPGVATPMHRTVSLDYNILVHGELILSLDDGSEVHLKNPGDVVVIKGSMHAWRNPSATEWARWTCVLVAAEPASVGGKFLEAEVKEA
ncbi:hypothetical protein FB45DRAFT_916877 [Roridomyces roridus]|uniref:Uncharacterized protein n=1 Tax=Roridomyces roridus TaxID=1738132 RepID=A0AAD7BU99_9AGAR|nr:hypothetical protein FB45DRAFT_916877 [Roridomyces roridus]